MNKLRELRDKVGKTRAEVSKDLDGQITVEQLKSYELESRYSEPPYRQLILLADYYGVGVDYILGHDEQVNNSLTDEARKFIASLGEDDLRNFNSLFTPYAKDSTPVIKILMSPLSLVYNTLNITEEYKESMSDKLTEALDNNNTKEVLQICAGFQEYAKALNGGHYANVKYTLEEIEEALKSRLPELTYADFLSDENFERVSDYIDDHEDEIDELLSSGDDDDGDS